MCSSVTKAYDLILYFGVFKGFVDNDIKNKYLEKRKKVAFDES